MLTSDYHLITGMIVGLAVAAPIGPVNIICIQKAVRKGFISAFIVGLGAAFGDSLFGAIAALGLTVVTDFVAIHTSWFEGVGAVVLLFMGWLSWRAHPHLTDPVPSAGDMLRGLAGTFMLTITNPMTALGFIALFAGMGLSRDLNRPEVATLVAGVFIGSGLWWLFISRLASAFRSRLADQHLVYINRGSAVMIWGFAGIAAVRALT